MPDLPSNPRQRPQGASPEGQPLGPGMQQARTIALAHAEIRAETYQGPLPPPQLLRDFDAIVPGAAERILAQWERQTTHRIDLERTVIYGDSRRAYLGIAAAFVITLVVLGVAAWLIVSGFAISGTIIGAFDIVGLVSVFIYGTHSRRQERQQKAERMTNPSPGRAVPQKRGGGKR